MKVMVTGGCGFIGSALVRLLMSKPEFGVVNLDKLTYSGDSAAVAQVSTDSRYQFVHGDICDAGLVGDLLTEHQPDFVVHLAAETHVDRSIFGPRVFVESNIVGTYTLLEQCLAYWQQLSEERKAAFRFLHISTDEVFGELGEEGSFSETTPYSPRSPYSASKAASDHLVRAWYHTYKFPALITNCSNNYGPFQFPEKLIPLMISNALKGNPLPVYGKGLQIRDWLHVEDHAEALVTVLKGGLIGESYNVGGNSERRNIDVVEKLCDILDEKKPLNSGSYRELITFVEDRQGHDFRYAIDARKIDEELQWQPKETFETGLACTVDWYLQNQSWIERMEVKLAEEAVSP